MAEQRPVYLTNMVDGWTNPQHQLTSDGSLVVGTSGGERMTMNFNTSSDRNLYRVTIVYPDDTLKIEMIVASSDEDARFKGVRLVPSFYEAEEVDLFIELVKVLKTKKQLKALTDSQAPDTRRG